MKISKIFSIACVCLLALGAIHANLQALPTGALPEPEFEKKNFLLTPDIPEMNVDFARLEAGGYSKSIKMVLLK